MISKDFYIHLGKLLYAVAKADGSVQDEELNSIYRLVVTEIKDDEIFGKNGNIDSYYTEFEFEELMDHNADVNDSLNSFLVFFRENHKEFTPLMLEITLNAAQRIAESYEGIIPEEQKILDLINDELKK